MPNVAQESSSPCIMQIASIEMDLHMSPTFLKSTGLHHSSPAKAPSNAHNYCSENSLFSMASFLKRTLLNLTVPISSLSLQPLYRLRLPFVLLLPHLLFLLLSVSLSQVSVFLVQVRNINSCFIKRVSPMKCPVPPLFCILPIIVFFAILGYQIMFSKGLLSMELINSLLVLRAASLSNETLTKYAAIDIGEEQLNQEIQKILDVDFDRQPQQRRFFPWRFNALHVHHEQWLEFRRVLSDWAQKKRFEPNIMSELTRLIKNPIDRGSDDRRYQSCAVVGNSGILLNSDYGELIDKHQVVIRLNNAQVERFEKKVGTKTNISFVNSNILHSCTRNRECFCHPYGKHIPMIMYICQPPHLLDYILCNSSHEAPLLVTDPRFDMLCARIVKYYSLKRYVEETGKGLEEWSSVHGGVFFHYSSGMQALVMALGICERVSMFGFGKSASAKHHYHTNQKAEFDLHDYEAEYDFYRDLVHGQRPIPFLPDSFKIPPLTIHQ